MLIALVDNQRTGPKPGLKGVCPVCSGPVIAKCGDQRIHHWAHRANKACDSWWEKETEWHRSWKNQFPSNWQEIVHHDEQTGEKHVADIKTTHGLVIEFQHSHLDPQERTSREKFYKNMVWVVNGTRLKNDYKRFTKEKEAFRAINEYFFAIHFPEECFPADWCKSSVPVVLDFRGDPTSTEAHGGIQEPLWCLFPGRAEKCAVIAPLSHNNFINNPHQLISACSIVGAYADYLRQTRQQSKTQADFLTRYEHAYRKRYGKKQRRF